MQQEQALRLAKFWARAKAALVDGVILGLATSVLVAGLALAFPNDIAMPFYRSTETFLVSEEAKEEGRTTITEKVHKEVHYDARGSVVSECLWTQTMREERSLITAIVSLFLGRGPVVKTEPCQENLREIEDWIIAILIVLYGTYFEKGPRSATIGKRLLGIRVVDKKGLPLTVWRALGRNLAEFLSYAFGITYFLALLTAKKQTLHDLIAGTLVVEASGFAAKAPMSGDPVERDLA